MKKLSINQYLAICWVVMLILNIIMIIWVMPKASQRIFDSADDPENAILLDTKFFGFNKSEAIEVLSAMGADGRKQYIRFHQKEDLIFPFAYGLFLTLTLFLLARNIFSGLWPALSISAIPIMAMLADLTENFHIMQLVKQFPELQSGTIQFASFANSVKWIFVIASFASAISFLIIITFGKLTKLKKPAFGTGK